MTIEITTVADDMVVVHDHHEVRRYEGLAPAAEHFFDGVDRCRHCIAEGNDAGGIHHDVEPTVSREGLGDDSSTVVRRAQVGDDVICPVRTGPCGGDDRGSTSTETVGDQAAETAGSARNERDRPGDVCRRAQEASRRRPLVSNMT